MGFVDQFNKRLAASGMSMGRCKQRYHRALALCWLLPAMVQNVRTALERLIEAEMLARLKRTAGNVGWARWLQIQLGKALCELGVRLAKMELGTAEYRAEKGEAPHWMSRGRSRRPLASVSSPPPMMPQFHKWVSFRATRSDYYRAERNDGIQMFYGRCELCSEEAAQQGASRKGRAVSGKEVSKTGSGCSVCLVYICKKCKESGLFDSYAHPGDCSGERATEELRD